MTKQGIEADRRKLLISKARAMFVAANMTKNISEAVRLYIEAHPEECAGITATITPREKDRPRTVLDDYERPLCPKCGGPLFFQVCSTCRATKRPKNEWVCKACGHRRLTKDTLEKSLAKLKRKEREGKDDAR